jgi:hypothetical protein
LTIPDGEIIGACASSVAAPSIKTDAINTAC